MDSIKNIVQHVVKNISEKKPETELKIQRVWQHILDHKAQQHTRLVGIKEGMLLVFVDSPVWLFQLNLQKRKIVKDIQQEAPEIKDVCLKIGKVS